MNTLPGMVAMQGTQGLGKSLSWDFAHEAKVRRAPAGATTYDLFYDDTKRKPYSFNLIDDDGKVLFQSKQYKTKAAAASAASRMF